MRNQLAKAIAIWKLPDISKGCSSCQRLAMHEAQEILVRATIGSLAPIYSPLVTVGNRQTCMYSRAVGASQAGQAMARPLFWLIGHWYYVHLACSNKTYYIAIITLPMIGLTTQKLLPTALCSYITSTIPRLVHALRDNEDLIYTLPIQYYRSHRRRKISGVGGHKLPCAE